MGTVQGRVYPACWLFLDGEYCDFKTVQIVLSQCYLDGMILLDDMQCILASRGSSYSVVPARTFTAGQQLCVLG